METSKSEAPNKSIYWANVHKHDGATHHFKFELVSALSVTDTPCVDWFVLSVNYVCRVSSAFDPVRGLIRELI